MLLTILSLSFVPSVSLAQQPTATIKTSSGTVLVSGQAAMVGTALRAGDTIQTQAGASAVLEFSDGSEIRVGENTQINITNLTQTATGARISTLNLVAGRVRALLSPEHQQAGSAFTVETPNARIDATFSEPDIEVSYNPESVETVGIAHTVKLMAKNLATDEEILVPVGFTVIITSEATKVLAGIILTSESIENESKPVSTPEPVLTASETTAGIGTGKMIAIGVGALAAIGGVIAVAGGSGGGGTSGSGNESGNSDTGDGTGDDTGDDTGSPGDGSDSSDVSFTGRFISYGPVSPGFTFTALLNLIQNGLSITGNFSHQIIDPGPPECVWGSTDRSVTGTVADEVSATLIISPTTCQVDCSDGTGYVIDCIGGTYGATLLDNGAALYLEPIGATELGPKDYTHQ